MHSAGGYAGERAASGGSGVDRTAFYGTRLYADLRAEFERRLRTLQQAGDQLDPRDAQITRLKPRSPG
ncbi:hypothetical protein [Parafrankia discariae]|uniref:hypothetical protein n=1 Tax=Parafrankia discariae TaxID=365528 RepID=UPI0003A72E7A|nr:hypothetical protein [Parafrankia discariae]